MCVKNDGAFCECCLKLGLIYPEMCVYFVNLISANVEVEISGIHHQLFFEQNFSKFCMNRLGVYITCCYYVIMLCTS